MKRRIVMLAAVLGIASFVASPALSQTSANFKLQEHVINAGGNPNGGSALVSSSFRIQLDSIGESVTGPGLASASWLVDAGFSSAYPPPGEVTGLRFGPGRVTLLWDLERSIGTYDLYRGMVPAFLPNYGVCSQSGMTAETVTDTVVPAAGGSLYYLVTARNRLSEEGTKGFASSGAERPNGSPCP
jgi:hypothetical protein